MHFRTDLVPCLPTHLYNQWWLDNAPHQKSGGAAIAIHKHCPLVPLDYYADPEGTFVFLKGTLFEPKLTLVAIYVPNTWQLAFLDKVLDSLST